MKPRNLANRADLASGETRLIHGVHAVTEWVRARPRQLLSLHYEAQAAERLRSLLQMATAAGITVRASDERALSVLAGSSRHQGVVATGKPFPYTELADAIAAKPRLLVVVDEIQDPHNLGAVLRTSEAVGAGAVIIPKDRAVPITATVEAAAAGAAALVPVCRVTNIARTLETLAQAGYWSVGLVPHGEVDLYRAEFPPSVAVVVGGESGMRPLVRRRCDLTISIPMAGRIESLNASVAAAVALYELFRRLRT